MASRLFFLVVALACVACFVATAGATETCPQAALRSDAWAQGVVNQLKSIRFSADRITYLREQILNDTRAISGAQLTWLLPPLVFSNDMVAAMNFTSPYVIGLNVSDFVAVLNVFSFSNDKLIVLEALRDTLLNASDENKQLIARSCFSFSSDQQKAYDTLRGVPSRDCVFGSVTAKSATFVIDVSGSMNTDFTLDGRRYTRLSYVKEHLSNVISQQLQPYQQYNILVYADNVLSCFNAPVNATANNIRAGLAFLNRYGASGGTNTYAALSKAFSSSADTVAVYLLSDGLPNSGQVPQIISALPQWNSKRSADHQIKIFSTAFLLGKSSESEKKQSASFMEQVASVTKGVFRNMDIQ